MHDASKPDVRGLEAEAYHQSGYFTAAQARSHGVTRQLLSHHVRHGRFTRLRRGLYRIQGFPSSENDELRETWMAVGTDKAILSHDSALALLDLSDTIPAAVHVLVSRRHRGLRPPPGVIVHTHPDGEAIATVWRDGLPLTAPARTLIDVAGEIQPEQASMAVGQALRRGLVTERQLEAEARRRRKQDVLHAVHAVDAPR
jgi:predicted transcriptional regulator of viral defense system